MTNPHPLAEDIKRWADGPDEWQWQVKPNDCPWENTTIQVVLAFRTKCVRLIPKRNLIPAHLLPEGWEVEREDWGYTVRRQPNDPVTETVAFPSALGELLRHIDKKAKT